MKDIVKSIFLLVVIYLLLFFLVNTNRKSQVTTEKQLQPVVITDTITNVLYDTLFVDHFEIVKLPVDTTVYYITDTVVRLDSIEVEVPISKFQFDTTVFTDTTQLNLSIRNSGFNVTLDSLSYSFTYRPTKINKIKKTHWFIGPSIGLGYDFTSGKLIPTVGIGIIIKRF